LGLIEAKRRETRTVMRRHGQIGVIKEVFVDRDGNVLVFRPLAPDPLTDTINELQVREYTEGYLLIERVPQ
jgi:hypothetical protein